MKPQNKRRISIISPISNSGNFQLEQVSAKQARFKMIGEPISGNAKDTRNRMIGKNREPVKGDS